jgi:predicted dehydrogenase
MDSVRFGIIGAGQIAGYVSGTFAASGDTPGVAAADVNTEAAGALAAKIGAEAHYDDYRRILERSDIDAVYIATPPYLHRPMLLDALDAGKHIICEKPFMLSAIEAADICRAAHARPTLKVGSCSSRFRQAQTGQRVREIVSQGALGSVYHLGFETVSAAPPVGTTVPAWRNDVKLNGGGISYDWGPYDLDWIGHTLGELFTPRRVFATLGGYFALTPERGCSAPDVDGRLNAQILCENGLMIQWERRTEEHGSARHSIEIRGTHGGIDTGMVPDGATASFKHRAYRGTADLEDIETLEHDFDWGEMLSFPINDLAIAITEDRSPAASPDSQLLLHTVLDAVVASAASNSTVDIPPHVQETSK